MSDPFLLKYKPSELQIAAEFFTNWLPFLTRDLCPACARNLSRRVRSLDPGSSGNVESSEPEVGFGDSTPAHAESCQASHANQDNSDSDTNSLGSWKDSANGWSAPVPDVIGTSASEAGILQTASVRMSWADMAQEDEFDVEVEEQQDEGESESDKLDLVVEVQPAGRKVVKKPVVLPREQREFLRFKNVQRKKDFIYLERVKGKIVNILEGLELHKCVFSAAEQERIVNLVYDLQEKGRKGELRERTYTAPQKWMPGKGRVTIQFGCCYNYAVDRDGNPPGILRNAQVDPIPPLFKVIIRRLVGWHVLPPSCVPDSCIVNIYDEGDCIPPHIDNHDFVRPFCTISFLSECNIVFGSNLAIVGPGMFSGATSIPLPVGSVLVLNGNGADVAKHCVPAVPTKRISITFRKMDEAKRPFDFVPEPDLQGLQPLPYEVHESDTPIIKSAPQLNQTPIIRSAPPPNRQPIIRDVQPIIRDRDLERPRRGFRGRGGSGSAPRQFDGNRSHPQNRQRMRINVDME